MGLTWGATPFRPRWRSLPAPSDSHVFWTLFISLVKFIAGICGAQRWASSGGCRRDTGCEERLPLELKSPSKLTKHSQSGNSWWGPSHVNLHIQLMHAYRMIVLILLRFRIWSVSGLKTRWAQQARFAGIWAETAQRRTAPASATLWAFSFGDGCKYHWCWCKMCILLWVTGKSGWNQQLVF